MLFKIVPRRQNEIFFCPFASPNTLGVKAVKVISRDKIHKAAYNPLKICFYLFILILVKN